MAEQTFGGYECEFIDEIPKEVQTECSICLHVLRDPQMVDCCGNRFCGRCIDKYLEKNDCCPLCKGECGDTIADKQLARTLKQKKVRCVHEEQGCEWTGILSLLDDHLDVSKRLEGCTFKVLTCKHCNKSLERAQIENHELKCHRKMVTCDYCEWYVCEKQNLLQHYDECELYPIACPKGCKATVTRVGLGEHVAKTCPSAIIDCKFTYAGCTVKMPRKNMPDHLEQSIHDHLTLLEAKYSKFETDYKNEQQRNEELTDDVDEATDREQERMAKKDADMTLVKRLCDQRAEFEFEYANNAVVVGNLGFGTTEDMLKSLFGQHGHVKTVKLYDYSSIAVVEYVSDDSIHYLFQKYNSDGIRLRKCQLKCVHLGY